MSRASEIGKRIKGLREAQGLSKTELGRQAGVTTTAVWNWEENGILPRAEAFRLTARALGVTETFLRTGVETYAAPSASPRSVAAIIESARNEIAAVTGTALENVRLRLELVSH